jgi:hypothetical protein
MSKGTVQREQIYVYGTCERCHAENVLVYELNDLLVCAHDYKKIVRNVDYKQPCDECGKEGAIRDPAHRRNEYLCISCHNKNGFTITNSIVKRAVSMLGVSRSILSPSAACYAAGYGSSCDNNIKPRSAWGGKLLCNTHGKTPPKPEKNKKS